jgi:hypothetical protein
MVGCQLDGCPFWGGSLCLPFYHEHKPLHCGAGRGPCLPLCFEIRQEHGEAGTTGRGHKVGCQGVLPVRSEHRECTASACSCVVGAVTVLQVSQKGQVVALEVAASWYQRRADDQCIFRATLSTHHLGCPAQTLLSGVMRAWSLWYTLRVKPGRSA